MAALVHGSGYERIASPRCSDRTIRRRVRAWAEAGLVQQLQALVRQEFVAAGVNRHDSPLLEPTLAGLEAWGADPAATTVHLDRGDDSGVTRALVDDLGFEGAIARRRLPAPIQAGTRWVVERTHAWMNGYGTLRRCTEKTRAVVELYLSLAGPTHHPAPQVMPIAGRS